MKYRCSICGNIYHNTTFKGGYVCEDCVDYIKSLPPPSVVKSSGKERREKRINIHGL